MEPVRNRCLPPVVNLDDIQAKWFQVLRRKRRIRRQPHFIRSARMVPGAVYIRPRPKLDLVPFSHRFGVGLQAEAAVVKKADQQGLGLARLARVHLQAAEVDLGVDQDLVLGERREEYANASFVGQIRADHAVAGFGIGDDAEGVAAPRIAHRRESTRAQGAGLVRTCPAGRLQRKQVEMVVDHSLLGAVCNFQIDLQKRTARLKRQRREPSVFESQYELS